MITAVDSNVLIDFFQPDEEFGPLAIGALQRCRSEGSLIACDIVWSEVAGLFPSRGAAYASLGRLGLDFDPVDIESALFAGEAWRTYRNRGGTRRRIVADFLIGSHAAHRADRLLTRDGGFYKKYFKTLELVDPTRESRN